MDSETIWTVFFDTRNDPLYQRLQKLRALCQVQYEEWEADYKRFTNGTKTKKQIVSIAKKEMQWWKEEVNSIDDQIQQLLTLKLNIFVKNTIKNL